MDKVLRFLGTVALISGVFFLLFDRDYPGATARFTAACAFYLAANVA